MSNVGDGYLAVYLLNLSLHNITKVLRIFLRELVDVLFEDFVVTINQDNSRWFDLVWTLENR
jgi:hypothetical protein